MKHDLNHVHQRYNLRQLNVEMQTKTGQVCCEIVLYMCIILERYSKQIAQVIDQYQLLLNLKCSYHIPVCNIYKTFIKSHGQPLPPFYVLPHTCMPLLRTILTHHSVLRYHQSYHVRLTNVINTKHSSVSSIVQRQ